jgi:hypothetical protein
MRTRTDQLNMKFELMYYLGLGYQEIMKMEMTELQWYHQKLLETKKAETELEQLKLDATLLAASGAAIRRAVNNKRGGLPSEGEKS